MTTNPAGIWPDIELDDVDLSDMEFWAGPREIREATFAKLRSTPGLRHYAERVIEESPFPPGPGYYALTRHDDIWHVSRNPKLFCSGQGSNIGDLPQEMNEFFGSMISMDDPKHLRLRSIVSKGFTPKEVTRVEGLVIEKARSSSTGSRKISPRRHATSSNTSRQRSHSRSSAT